MQNLDLHQKITASVGAAMVALTLWVGFVSPPPTDEERARAASVLLPPERPAALAAELPEEDTPTVGNDNGNDNDNDNGNGNGNGTGDDQGDGTVDEPEVDDAGILTVAAQRDAWLRAFDEGAIDLFGVMTERGFVAEVDRTVGLVEREPDIVQIALGWPHDGLDPARIAAVTDRGAMPMISWEPWKFRASQPALQPEYSLQNIVDGDFDLYIERFATSIAELDHPIMIRLAHEMNGSWYPWAEGINDNGRGSYVLFWRAVVARVERIAPDHVIWVWSPNVRFGGSTELEGLYPGDDAVDLIGLVGYFGHLSDTPTSYPTFDELFGPTLDEIRELTDLPILITETSATEEGGLKPAWTLDLFEGVAANRDVIGLVWFDVDKEADWRVDSSPEALAAIQAGLELPTFRLDG